MCNENGCIVESETAQPDAEVPEEVDTEMDESAQVDMSASDASASDASVRDASAPAVAASDSDLPPIECGGCSTPPSCREDGTSPFAPCSCGCPYGETFGGGVCNGYGCLIPPIACEGAAAAAPAESVVAPSVDEWKAVSAKLTSRSGEALPSSIAFAPCREGSWSVWLPEGSAYVQVHPRDDRDCEVWLGGETEDPMYDGTPTQYCRFPPVCQPINLATDTGGPARIDSPYCTGL